MSKQDAIKEKLKEAKEIKQLDDDDLEKVTGGTGEGVLGIDDPLVSVMRINGAADDSSGYAIS